MGVEGLKKPLSGELGELSAEDDGCSEGAGFTSAAIDELMDHYTWDNRDAMWEKNRQS